MSRIISITDDRYLAALRDVLQPLDVNDAWQRFVQKPTQDLLLSTLNASIYSSEIEGEDQKIPVSQQRIADLEQAYQFAQKNRLTEKTFLETHQILSTNLVSDEQRGAYRKQALVIRSAKDIVYFAADAQDVPQLMTTLFSDVKRLQDARAGVLPTALRAFYHAALLHLLFINIHPFRDGNGRAARLLEKWFLAEKLGEMAWRLPSEKYYVGNMNRYFDALRRLGDSFNSLNYDLSLPFFTLLPKCLFESAEEN
jgi:Fic family protein